MRPLRLAGWGPGPWLFAGRRGPCPRLPVWVVVGRPRGGLHARPHRHPDGEALLSGQGCLWWELGSAEGVGALSLHRLELASDPGGPPCSDRRVGKKLEPAQGRESHVPFELFSFGERHDRGFLEDSLPG